MSKAKPTSAMAVVPKPRVKLEDVTEQLADCLAAGGTPEAAADAVGLPAHEVWDALDVGYLSPQHSAVQQDMNRLRFVRHAAFRNRLEYLAGKAVLTLETALDQGDLRAAAIVLRAAGLDTPNARIHGHG